MRQREENGYFALTCKLSCLIQLYPKINYHGIDKKAW